MINKTPGFTFIELLLAAAIAGLVGVLVAAIYFANFRLFSNQDAAIQISDQNRLALDEITNQIRQSTEVFGGCGVGGSPNDRLFLKLWRLDMNGDPITGIPQDQIRYEFKDSANTLTKDVNSLRGSLRKPLTDKIIATKIKTVVFDCGGVSNFSNVQQITIRLTTEATTFNKTHEVIQEAKGLLRNKQSSTAAGCSPPNDIITNPVNSDVTVPASTTCTVNSTSVNGNFDDVEGTLVLNDATVNGNIKNVAEEKVILNNATVNGNIFLAGGVLEGTGLITGKIECDPALGGTNNFTGTLNGNNEC